MKYSTFIKSLTLLSFVVLISCFLLYSTGRFDVYFSNKESSLQSPNGGIANSIKTDTSKPKKDSAGKLMLSSSKVIILTADKKRSLDSPYQKNQTDTSKIKKGEMLRGSKSGYIFKPSDLKIAPVSIQIDTTKIKKQ